MNLKYFSHTIFLIKMWFLAGVHQTFELQKLLNVNSYYVYIMLVNTLFNYISPLENIGDMPKDKSIIAILCIE